MRSKLSALCVKRVTVKERIKNLNSINPVMYEGKVIKTYLHQRLLTYQLVYFHAKCAKKIRKGR